MVAGELYGTGFGDHVQSNVGRMKVAGLNSSLRPGWWVEAAACCAVYCKLLTPLLSRTFKEAYVVSGPAAAAPPPPPRGGDLLV